MRDKNIETLEELIRTAKSVLDLHHAGLIVDMDDSEKERFKLQFPDAEMVLGNFIIKKVKHANSIP